VPIDPKGVPRSALHPVDAQAAVLAQTNAARAQYGCKRPLRLNTRLTRAAERQAKAMAEQDFFDHVMPDGTDLADRVRTTGYRFEKITENIAAGQPDTTSALRSWMASPLHRTNILDCSVTELGVGYVYDPSDRPFPGDPSPQFTYWVQVFGKPLVR
jgi:uncharacterized protein YkwD